MDKLFLTILNMSFTGAFVIAGICIARLPLRKAPKIISYCLWAVAGFRLLFRDVFGIVRKSDEAASFTRFLWKHQRKTINSNLA